MKDVKLLEGFFARAMKASLYDDARGILDELAQSETWRKRNPDYLDRYAAIPFLDSDTGSSAQARPVVSADTNSNVVMAFHSTKATASQHGPENGKTPQPDTSMDTGGPSRRAVPRPPVPEWWPSRI